MSKSNHDKPCTANRRSMLKLGFSIGMLPAIAAVAKNSYARNQFTPPQTKGPFYPIHQQSDKDTNLVLIQGRDAHAKGKVINVKGRVLSAGGQALENAVVEIWQADTNGRYRHVRDPNPAPLDDNFQGWGISRSDKQGRYGFVTILPGAYPAGPGWTRPPHIHFKVVMKGYHPLITQMYFPGNSLNNADLILQNLSQTDQQMVISKQQKDEKGRDSYLFDIYLKPES